MRWFTWLASASCIVGCMASGDDSPGATSDLCSQAAAHFAQCTDMAIDLGECLPEEAERLLATSCEEFDTLAADVKADGFVFWHGEGDWCLLSAQCDGGLICIDWVCAPEETRRADGYSCASDEECFEGSYCRPTRAGSKVCSPAGRRYDLCAEDAQCEADLVCRPTSEPPLQECNAPGTRYGRGSQTCGARCFEDEDCATGLVCLAASAPERQSGRCASPGEKIASTCGL